MATPEPTTTPDAATPTPGGDAPELPFEVQLRELAEGAPVPIEGFAVVIEEGCWQCDGPPTALRRYYTDPAGELRSDLLFEAPGETYINYAYDISHDMQRMLVTVCAVGYCGGVGEPSEDAAVAAYASLDGGITWEIVAEHDAPGWFFLSNEPGEYVLATWADPEGGDYSEIYRFVGETDTLTPQEAAAYTGRHIISEDGKAVLVPDGSELWRVPDDRLVLDSFLHPQGRPSGWVQLRWEDEAAGDPGDKPQAVYAGTLFEGMVGPAYNLSDIGDGQRLEPHGWLDDRYVVGTVTGDFPRPVIIDTQDQTYHPLDGPFEREAPAGSNFAFNRNFATAGVTGPFVRIVSGDECLNVREAPGTGAQVLGCYADGVLLRTDLTAEQADGTTWLQVLTPENQQGWAAAEFLEY